MNIESRFQLASVLIITVFYVLILAFSVNVPQQDDYDAIIGYLLGSQESVIRGLFDIHVNHRLVATRLLSRFSLVFGEGVNLKFIVVIGASSLLGMVYFLYRSIVDVSNKSFLLLLVCLSIFSLFHWSNMIWATAAAQNYISLFTAVMAFYFFSRKTAWGPFAAVFLGIIAPYINSNGLLVLPMLLLCSVIRGRKQSTNSKLTAPIAILTIISFYLFFYALPGTLGTSSALNLDTPGLESLWVVIKSYFIATAGYLHFEPLAFIGGLLINIYFVTIIAFRYFRKNEVVFYTFLYILLSIMIIAIFRHEMGLRQLIASRYQVLTLTINALVAISFFELGLQRYLAVRYFRGTIIAMFAALYLASFYYVGNLASERDRIWNGLLEWRSAGGSLLYYPEPERASELLSLAIDADIYSLPPDT